MATDLDRLPDLGPSYRRAIARALPLPGRAAGDALPDRVLRVAGVRMDRGELAAYGRVCGFPLRDTLPGTYPHVLAFPLALSLMTEPDFPFPLVGLVHVANRIEVRRGLSVDDALAVTARAEGLRGHPRGRQFDVVVEVADAAGVAWRGVSTYLRRGSTDGSDEAGVSPVDPDGGSAPADSAGDSVPAGAEGGSAPAGSAGAGGSGGRSGGGGPGGDGRPGGGAGGAPGGVGGPSGDRDAGGELPAGARWRVGGGTGAAYAAVSGDRNPIHTSLVGARLFGFRRPIAHGMWSKARCLAALDPRLPDAYTVDVAFHAPILLPSTVEFAAAAEDDDAWRFALRRAGGDRVHLTGRIH
ncbi:hypothetical protein GCM10010123_18940 [Pilimelia anulata]|uniref:MaoC-like domain-containing protein n=2 Tax=Pilimelia anulata TaxID=53371 RepID=A0A8J3B913_9ACTN|nr:hypothetical protein GCM10010123_18940 [Pilimelia anulata]